MLKNKGILALKLPWHAYINVKMTIILTFIYEHDKFHVELGMKKLLSAMIWYQVFCKAATGGVGGGGEGADISYIRMLGPYFWVQNFEFQYYLGGGAGGSEK